MQPIKCPACSKASESPSETFPVLSARGLNPWKRCSACKAYFLVGDFVADKEVAHTKNTSWGRGDTGTELNKFKKRMFLSVIDLVNKYCPPPAALLDVGCSYGGFLMEAKRTGYNVRGFDIVPRAVEYVKTQGIPAEVCFSIGELDAVKDASLDVVTCLDCHCYWSDQASEIGHAFAKLKPGGYLAMRVVDKSWMFSIGLSARKLSLALGERIIRAAVNDHRFSMPLRSLLNVIRANGFDVIYASPRGAIHSDHTRWPVKACFVLGIALWQAGAGMVLAPGALVLARKPV